MRVSAISTERPTSRLRAVNMSDHRGSRWTSPSRAGLPQGTERPLCAHVHLRREQHFAQATTGAVPGPTALRGRWPPAGARWRTL
eukprot:7384784-Prymnesium_polylepis.1